jgi:hypothetical protein
MTRVPDAEQQLAHYREMKRLAVESYRRKLAGSRPAGTRRCRLIFSR